MCISTQWVHVVISIGGRADLDLSPTTEDCDVFRGVYLIVSKDGPQGYSDTQASEHIHKAPHNLQATLSLTNGKKISGVSLERLPRPGISPIALSG